MKHEPLRPPREGRIGEQVYASMWAAMMAEDWSEGWIDEANPRPLSHILYTRRHVQQRQATVAASIVCWLGCNLGQSILLRAASEVKAGRWQKHESYLLAWTLENTRRVGFNHGVRSVEYLLSPADAYQQRSNFLTAGITELPHLSALDLEVIDHVMLWLATEKGQRFIRQCEAEINRLQDEERRRKEAEWRRDRNQAEAD